MSFPDVSGTQRLCVAASQPRHGGLDIVIRIPSTGSCLSSGCKCIDCMADSAITDQDAPTWIPGHGLSHGTSGVIVRPEGGAVRRRLFNTVSPARFSRFWRSGRGCSAVARFPTAKLIHTGLTRMLNCVKYILKYTIDSTLQSFSGVFGALFAASGNVFH